MTTPDIIPAGASARVHVVECRRSPAHPWCLYGRAPDRATAAQRLRELVLRLGAENVRMRPCNPSDAANLHRDDARALLYALRRGGVTTAALADQLGDARDDVIANRASRAVRRLRDADFLRPNDALGVGANVLTPAGRRLAVSLKPDRTNVPMKIASTTKTGTKRAPFPPIRHSAPLDLRAPGARLFAPPLPRLVVPHEDTEGK